MSTFYSYNWNAVNDVEQYFAPNQPLTKNTNLVFNSLEANNAMIFNPVITLTNAVAADTTFYVQGYQQSSLLNGTAFFAAGDEETAIVLGDNGEPLYVNKLSMVSTLQAVVANTKIEVGINDDNKIGYYIAPIPIDISSTFQQITWGLQVTSLEDPVDDLLEIGITFNNSEGSLPFSLSSALANNQISWDATKLKSQDITYSNKIGSYLILKPAKIDISFSIQYLQL